jgi:hypothetical protein
VKFITHILNLRMLAIALLAFAMAGCLQIETHVKLHENGSATITERVQFSKRLLQFRDKKNPKLNIAGLLEKQAVLDRMKHMGKGIALVSHKVRDAEKGARECVSVFKIPQITDFRYVSPYLGKGDYAKEKAIVCKTWPYYKNSWTRTRAGWMAIGFHSVSKRHGKPGYKVPSPADIQVYRQLKPVFADMLKGFRLKFVFEGYGPAVVRRAGQRDSGTRTHLAHLIDVSSENLDRYGAKFLANEEVMAELLQMQINGPHVIANSGYGSTSQLFRFYDGGCEVMFRPSKHYFGKHFVGKTLSFGRFGTRKADFKKDGYHPEPNGKKK